MANLIYRASSAATLPGSTSVKNAPLTNLEVDANFRSLKIEVDSAYAATSTATSNSIVSTLVKRDESGDFSANAVNLTSLTATTVSATDINSTSDARLKQSLQPIDGLHTLQKLQPIQFSWTQSGNISYGLIAQELEQVLPELVSEREDGFKTVSYIPLIAFLIQAVKELDEKINQLQK